MRHLSEILLSLASLTIDEKERTRSVVRRRTGGRALRCPAGETRDEKTGRCRRETPKEKSLVRKRRVKQRAASKRSQKKRTDAKRKRQARLLARFKKSRGLLRQSSDPVHLSAYLTELLELVTRS